MLPVQLRDTHWNQLLGKEVHSYLHSGLFSLQLFTFNAILLSDNRQLPINRKQKVFPNGTLIIENVERSSDQATYTCVARNAQGHTAKGNLEVQVMGESFFVQFIQLYIFSLFFIFTLLRSDKLLKRNIIFLLQYNIYTYYVKSATSCLCLWTMVFLSLKYDF